MTSFAVHFFQCNVLISILISVLMLAKKILKNLLTPRICYNFWILMFFFMCLPFVPFQGIEFPFYQSFALASVSDSNIVSAEPLHSRLINTSARIQDYAVSKTSSSWDFVLFIMLCFWLLGILYLSYKMIKSFFALQNLKKSALPLQNALVLKIYEECIFKVGLKKYPKLYSTAFIKSPITTGFFFPAIFFPIHMISEQDDVAIRHMLLHELCHYKYKDILVGYFMSIAGMVYWFNPMVRLAIKDMKIECEIACDTSVLCLLGSDSYVAYGQTLLRFAEKFANFSSPFMAGLSGSMSQIKPRIVNISTFHHFSFHKYVKSCIIFLIISLMLFQLSPLFSGKVLDNDHYAFDVQNKNILSENFSSDFSSYKGSFVLYDISKNSWIIYHMDLATKRVSPDSTYKIYDALFALDENIITRQDSTIQWDNTPHPFKAWEADQNLDTAIANSVNWYFDSLNEKMGAKILSDSFKKIHYGNMLLANQSYDFWMESSLKISPIEQVELLTKLYNQDLDYTKEDMLRVKESMYLATSPKGTLYGKTGTGRIDGHDKNGWFVGLIEGHEEVYIFATNIQAEDNANGTQASNITLKILEKMNLWVQ